MAASSITKWVLFFAFISGLLLQNRVEAQAAQEEEKQPSKVFCGLFGLSNRKLIEAPAPAPKTHHHHKHLKHHHKGAAAPKPHHHKHHKKSAAAPAPAAAEWKHHNGHKKGTY